MADPAWLPPITPVGADWLADEARLYERFQELFIDNEFFFQGQKVFVDKMIEEGDKEEGFWHLITKTDSQSKERLVDPRRAERFEWCAAVLQNADDMAVTVFEFMHGNGKKRTLVWLKDKDYVVILQPLKNGTATQLITAYVIEGSSNRRWIQQQYDNRIQN